MVQIINDEFWDNNGFLYKGLAKDLVLKIENDFGVTFPSAYVRLITSHNGGNVKCREFLYFDVYQGEKSWGGIDLLPLTDEIDNVVQTLMDPPEFFPKGLIPFADDGGGDLTCFDYRNCKENPPIVFWVCGEPEGEDTHFVANSFDEFLGMLHEPEPLPEDL